jgi:hypothetical protein
MLYLIPEEFEQFCEKHRIRYFFKTEGINHTLSVYIKENTYKVSNFGFNVECCKRKLYELMTGAINNLEICCEPPFINGQGKYDFLRTHQLR